MRDHDEKVHLLAAAFDDEYKADEARLVLRRAQGEGLVDLVEMAVVVRGLDGKLTLNQDVDLTARRRSEGHWLGIVAALVTGVQPLILLGTAAGEIVGMLTDRGITSSEMKAVGNALVPGTSALFILGRRGKHAAEVASRLQQLKPKIARTNLEPADVEALRAAFASATRAAAPDPGPEQAGQADG